MTTGLIAIIATICIIVAVSLVTCLRYVKIKFDDISGSYKQRINVPIGITSDVMPKLPLDQKLSTVDKLITNSPNLNKQNEEINFPKEFENTTDDTENLFCETKDLLSQRGLQRSSGYVQHTASDYDIAQSIEETQTALGGPVKVLDENDSLRNGYVQYDHFSISRPDIQGSLTKDEDIGQNSKPSSGYVSAVHHENLRSSSSHELVSLETDFSPTCLPIAKLKSDDKRSPTKDEDTTIQQMIELSDSLKPSSGYVSVLAHLDQTRLNNHRYVDTDFSPEGMDTANIKQSMIYKDDDETTVTSYNGSSEFPSYKTIGNGSGYVQLDFSHGGSLPPELLQQVSQDFDERLTSVHHVMKGMTDDQVASEYDLKENVYLSKKISVKSNTNGYIEHPLSLFESDEKDAVVDHSLEELYEQDATENDHKKSQAEETDNGEGNPLPRENAEAYDRINSESHIYETLSAEVTGHVLKKELHKHETSINTFKNSLILEETGLKRNEINYEKPSFLKDCTGDGRIVKKDVSEHEFLSSVDSQHCFLSGTVFKEASTSEIKTANPNTKNSDLGMISLLPLHYSLSVVQENVQKEMTRPGSDLAYVRLPEVLPKHSVEKLPEDILCKSIDLGEASNLLNGYVNGHNIEDEKEMFAKISQAIPTNQNPGIPLDDTQFGYCRVGDGE